MDRLAAIKSGVVENVIAITPETTGNAIAHLESQNYLCVVTDQPVGPGWTYSNFEFAPPVTPTAPTPPYAWLIDIGPFFDRFGAKKLVVLASADATVQAILKDVQVRKWVDLERPDVGQALDVFIAKGLINVDDKVAILATPVSYTENLALCKTYFA